MTPTYEILIDIPITEHVELQVRGYAYAPDADGWDGWRVAPSYRLVGVTHCPVPESIALGLAADELSAVDLAQARHRVDEMAERQAAGKHRDQRSAA